MFFGDGQRFRRRRSAKLVHTRIEGGRCRRFSMDGWLPMLKRYSSREKKRRRGGGKAEKETLECHQFISPVRRRFWLLGSRGFRDLPDLPGGLRTTALPQRGGPSWLASRVSSWTATHMRRAPASERESGSPLTSLGRPVDRGVIN